EKMQLSATLSYDRADENITHSLYRPLATSVQKRLQISSTMMNKNKILNELREKFQKDIMLNEINDHLSQSELHLKAMLGETYQEGKLEVNVSQFLHQFKYYFKQSDQILSEKEREKLTNQCVML